jgi:hypothetical protein
MEWAEAKLDEAVSKSDDETQRAVGNVAKRSVIRRLQNVTVLEQGPRAPSRVGIGEALRLGNS